MDQKNTTFSNYTKVEDFVVDETFQHWVFNNELSAEEHWNHFVLEHPDREPIIEQAKQVLLSLNIKKEYPFTEDEAKEIWRDIKITIAKEDIAIESQTTTVYKSAKFISWRGWIKYAAVFAFGIGLAWVVMDRDNAQEQRPRQTTLVQKKNSHGVKSHVQLPDGTHVWLNAASMIEYEDNFSDSARLIKLTGEAYFEVAKDAERPFRVTAGQYVTTALGTSFNINSFSDNNIRVSLFTGKVNVKVIGSAQSVSLLPGSQAYVDDSQLSITKFDEFSIIAWKEGTITFEETQFDEMINVLERWYDVKFEVHNLSEGEKGQLVATVKFENQTVKNVLNVLSHTMKFEYTIHNKIVTIDFDDMNK